MEIKITTIGSQEIARQLEAGPGAIRAAIRNELAAIGDEIIADASSRAPVGKEGHSKYHLRDSFVAYFGEEATAKQRRKLGVNRFGGLDADRGPVLFTVRPVGRVAHLIERGVRGPRKAHTRRLQGRSMAGVIGKGKRVKYGLVAQGVAFVKQSPFSFPAHPFFMPAVAAVGDVGARLQSVLDTDAVALVQGAA